MSLRGLAIGLGVIVLAGVGVGGALAFFSARDDATVARERGPGEDRPRNARPRVKPGNVLLLYGRAALARPVRSMAWEISGPPDSALAAAGQAVLVRSARGGDIEILALSATRRLEADSADDPDLRAFVEFWLGRDTR